jgi:hypothetical protein
LHSIVMRVRRVSTSGVFCSFGDGGAGTFNTITYTSVAGTTARAARIDGGATTNSDVTTTVANNTWYTLGWNYRSGGVYECFKDGVSVGTTAANTRSVSGVTLFTMLNADAAATAASIYLAGVKGWSGLNINAAQHAYEHTQFAWAA